MSAKAATASPMVESGLRVMSEVRKWEIKYG